jgi:CheY-like chemotaxis protein
VRLPALGQRLAAGEHAVLPTGAVKAAAVSSAGDLAGARILVVDDAPDTRDVLEVLLTQSGAEVRAVGSAAEALAEVEAWRPDIIVSDIGMPDEDGYELIRKVRGLGREKGALPAIALTAFAQAQDRVRALTAGFNLHVPKPVDPAELAAAIASLLGKNKQAQHVL